MLLAFYKISTILKQFNPQNGFKFFDALKNEPIAQILQNVLVFFKIELNKTQIKRRFIEYKIEELFLIEENTLKLTGWLVSKLPIIKFVLKIGNNVEFEIYSKYKRDDVLKSFPDFTAHENQGFSHKIPISSLDLEQLRNTEKVTFKIVDSENRTFEFEEMIQKPSDNPAKISEVIRLLESKKSKPVFFESKIDIIIAVYNGFEFLEPLFDSIKKNTEINYRLIIVDDASTDKKINDFLDQLKNRFEKVLVIKNKKNVGFVKSVNIGVKHSNNHFVILNTDVEVPKNWLAKLMQPILKNNNIASVTPFTNTGTICSFPAFNENNKIFANADLNKINEVFDVDIGAFQLQKEIPTGVGFCMGVNKNVVNEIGFFDEKTFGKGYAEENDWCRTAVKNGFKNYIVPNLYVKHHNGGSFEKKEKTKLLKQNLVKLSKKHPEYNNEVWSYLRKNPLHDFRSSLIFKLMNHLSNDLIFVIDHDNGGGANIYRNIKIKRWLADNKMILKVVYKKNIQKYALIAYYRTYKQSVEFDNFESLEKMLLLTKIKSIFVNELVGFPNIKNWIDFVLNLKRKYKFKLTFPVHDFHAICPSYTLLNSAEKFCNVPTNVNKCLNCINYIKHIDVDSLDVINWRKIWKKFLLNCDEILCFSNSSKILLIKGYPFLKSANTISVKPHKVIDNLNAVKNVKNGKLKIGVLGTINLQKGSKVVLAMSKWLERNNKNAEIVVLGELENNTKLMLNGIPKKLKVTGKYTNGQLQDLVELNKINVFFIPSIWPETFSFTSEEIMKMKMPIAVYNIGAHAERVAVYNKGKIFDLDESFETIYAGLESLSDPNINSSITNAQLLEQ